MAAAATATPIRLGLRENWPQFALLVLVNGFVGAMVGQERAVLPLLARERFGVATTGAALSFIVSFGLVKALANLAAGHLADRAGRKRLLVIGWLFGLAVPLLLIRAPSWGWVVFANVLLGVNQGLCWSTTVIMKIDLVGPGRRGLAMGINEFAGYVAVAGMALLTGFVAAQSGMRSAAPFYPGVGVAVLGLLISAFAVRDTGGHVRAEADHATDPPPRPAFAQVLLLGSWKDRALFSASQAGLVNNLNDAVVWGLVPVLLAEAGLSVRQVAAVAALYPAVWGIGQLVTGVLSDRVGRRWPIAGGMLVQALGLALFGAARGYAAWLTAAALLGLGTALVYPTLIAAVSDVARPEWRATAVGVYRLWRDAGYVVGGLAAGTLADRFGLDSTIGIVALLTLASGLHVALRMPETLLTRGAGGASSHPSNTDRSANAVG